MQSAGVGEEVGERLVLFLPWVGFRGGEVLCLPFSLHPPSLGRSSYVCPAAGPLGACDGPVTHVAVPRGAQLSGRSNFE